jgi:hypothetical protein
MPRTVRQRIGEDRWSIVPYQYTQSSAKLASLTIINRHIQFHSKLSCSTVLFDSLSFMYFPLLLPLFCRRIKDFLSPFPCPLSTVPTSVSFARCTLLSSPTVLIYCALLLCSSTVLLAARFFYRSLLLSPSSVEGRCSSTAPLLLLYWSFTVPRCSSTFDCSSHFSAPLRFFCRPYFPNI